MTRRYASLDLWRGVAALMVVVYHSAREARAQMGDVAPCPLYGLVLRVEDTMWRGVPLFFVISGYCIAASTERGSTFAKRVHRIFPPYLASLSLALLVLPTPHLTPFQWLTNVTLTEGWAHELTGEPRTLLLDPAWTLSYEEQFYAVCALLAGVAFLRRAAWLTVVVIAALPWTLAVEGRADGFFFDGLWLTFACGVLVYYVRTKAPSLRPRAIVFLLAASAFWTVARVWWLPVHGASFWTLYKASELLLAPVFAALLLAIQGWDAQLSRVRPLMWLGSISYSLYLIHTPVLYVTSRAISSAPMLGQVVGVVASVVSAYAFHLGVERRFMTQKSEVRVAASV